MLLRRRALIFHQPPAIFHRPAGWDRAGCRSISVTLKNSSWHVRRPPGTSHASVHPTKFGEWLSLVEHLVRDQGVGGSNPLSPTI